MHLCSDCDRRTCSLNDRDDDDNDDDDADDDDNLVRVCRRYVTLA